MTSRAKRLALMIGVAALVAVIGGAMVATDTVAAPSKGGKGNTGFVITTTELVYYTPNGTRGSFTARGAISDRGTARSGPALEGIADLELTGKKGDIYIDIDGDTFEIVAATDKHSQTVGATGSYWEEYYELEESPFNVCCGLDRTLAGSLPQ